MIRKLLQSDWEAYKVLRIRSLQSDPDVFFSTEAELSSWPDGNFKSEIYSQPDSHFGYLGSFYPRAGGDPSKLELVGYTSLSGQYFAKQRHIADVFNLYVDPAYRGQGIARELVTSLIQHAKDTGRIEKLFLSVMSQNTPAITLYTSLGFSIYGTKRHAIKSGDQYFDETLMELDLS